MKNEWRPVIENSEKKDRYEICNFELDEMTKLIQALRQQVKDEYEEGTIIQVFGGAFGSTKGQVFAARDGEKIADIGAVSVKDGEMGILEAIYVSKDYRGRRIAKDIVEREMGYLIEEKVKKIKINVSSEGSRAIGKSLKAKWGDIIDVQDHGNYFE